MLVTAYGGNAMSRFKRLQQGREDVEDDPHNGRPKTTSNTGLVNKVRHLLATNSRPTRRMMATELTVNKESIRSIITSDLGKTSQDGTEKVKKRPNSNKKGVKGNSPKRHKFSETVLNLSSK